MSGLAYCPLKLVAQWNCNPYTLAMPLDTMKDTPRPLDPLEENHVQSQGVAKSVGSEHMFSYNFRS